MRLLLLFFWSPAHAVWPNYEVVLFQPWSGTDPSLGSVANITSYINVAPPLNSLLNLFPSPSVSLIPPPPYWFWIAFPLGQVCTPAVLHHLSLHSLSCRPWPDPQVPLIPYSPTPRACFCCLSPICSSPFRRPQLRFCPWRPLWVLSSRFRLPSVISSYHYPPLLASTCGPFHVGPKEGSVSNPCPPLPLLRASSSLAVVKSCILVSSGGLSSSRRRSVFWREAREFPLPGDRLPQPPSPRY